MTQSSRLSEHFTADEFACKCANPGCSGKTLEVHPGLVLRLETMRIATHSPLVVLSGVRCPEHNRAVGGKPESAHLSGEAVDLVCMNSVARYWALVAARTAGFRRIGVGKTFVHVDVSRSLAQDVVWLYS